MTYRMLAAPALLALAAAWAAGQGGSGKDQVKFQGTWDVVSIEFGGKKATPEQIKEKSPALTFKGDRYAEAVEGKVIEQGTYRLDEGKTPRQITLQITDGRDRGKTQFGIYKVDGDTITVAMAPAGSKDRPATFTSKDGDSVNVSVLRRRKGGAKE